MILSLVPLAGCEPISRVLGLDDAPVPPSPLYQVIPRPVETIPGVGTFELRPTVEILINDPSLRSVAQLLAEVLRGSSGFEIPVRPSVEPALGTIFLKGVEDAGLGSEGYRLTITTDGVTIEGAGKAGLFWGVQTLRQLLPARVERSVEQAGPWHIPTGTIVDHPRFAWRGAMLDVARRFFPPSEVKRFIDSMAYYKLNRLHLHLTDHQGWRIMIESWPDLALFGGQTQVGGGPGGFYTQDEYRELVSYAAARQVMIVPEIDMPGHATAALASYSELNCGGVRPPIYTGGDLQFANLCVESDRIYDFVEDVVSEIAAMTPGPYIHLGGDEAFGLPDDQYIEFMRRAERIVASSGKRMIGWEEISAAKLPAATIAQYWLSTDRLAAALANGHPVIMSPASHAYLDSKYDAASPIGQSWTGAFLDVEKAYAWDPVPRGVSADAILGIEAPLWTETVTSLADAEYLAFPRLIGHAELGWSPRSGRNWREYRMRLATHGPRLESRDISFFRSRRVAWE